jgi:endonuclease/exonuclease/phosphatase (EEP) superfamily protein YafD
MVSLPDASTLVRRGATVLGILGLLPLTVVTLCYFFAPGDHPLSLLTHFVPLYCAGAIALAGITILSRKRLLISAAVLLAAIQVSLIAPYLPASGTAYAAEGSDLRVLVANVWCYNRQKYLMRPMIRSHDADIVVLVEIDKAGMRALPDLHEEYPYHLSEPRKRGAGIAIYSRLPLRNLAVEVPGHAGMPAIRGEAQVANQWVTFFAVHNVPPVPLSLLPRGERHNKALIRMVQEVDGPVLVVGDLNTSMWGPWYRSLIEATGLRNSREGFGLVPTYPADMWPVLLPIDHVLMDESWSVQGNKVGEAFGSDHLPLVVDLRLKPQG